MKTDVVSKTYRVKTITVKKIQQFAKNEKLSQSKAITSLIDTAFRYLEERELDKELNELQEDQAWMQANLEWAETNLN